MTDTRPPATAWYVIHTKPKQEARALDKLAEQDFEVWLPQLTQWRRVKQVWQRKVTPMFPRYLFLRPAHAEHSIAPVRSTPGVSNMVRFGDEPAVIQHDAVLALRQIEAAAAAEPETTTSPFTEGEAVRIVSGPFVGLEAIVKRPALERVTILLTLLNREQEIKIDPKALHKIA